jgi:1,4-dihydroxy-6-naphthoate synthase
MKLTLGYSPCPNDCFIFDALVHGKIDTEDLSFEIQLEDVETLNKKALAGGLDITKLSFHAYGFALKKYILLRAGSALGFNCGPILIRKKNVSKKNVEEMKVAIPGKLTTANFLLSLAYPNVTYKTEFVFSEIENAVLNGTVDAGLIIHENRFTYQEKGLEKIIDLGEFWDSLIHAPIPLGGIVARRTFDDKLLQKINRVIRKSVEYAFDNPESSKEYVRKNAQEMSEDVMQKHIHLYVNKFSVDLGGEGTKAVELMFSKAHEVGLFKTTGEKLLID